MSNRGCGRVMSSSAAGLGGGLGSAGAGRLSSRRARGRRGRVGRAGSGACGGPGGEGGSDEAEGLGDLLDLVVGVTELFGDVAGEPVASNIVLVVPDDVGGVAQLVGEPLQDRGLLLGAGRGVGGLQERVERGGQRSVVGREAEEAGVHCLGESGDGSAPAAMAVLDRGLPEGAEADGHVTGSGAGMELVGQRLCKIMCSQELGRRGELLACRAVGGGPGRSVRRDGGGGSRASCRPGRGGCGGSGPDEHGGESAAAVAGEVDALVVQDERARFAVYETAAFEGADGADAHPDVPASEARLVQVAGEGDASRGDGFQRRALGGREGRRPETGCELLAVQLDGDQAGGGHAVLVAERGEACGEGDAAPDFEPVLPHDLRLAARVSGFPEDVRGVEEVVGGEDGERGELHRTLRGGLDLRGVAQARHGAQGLRHVERFAGQGLGGGATAGEVAARVRAVQEGDVRQGVVVAGEVGAEAEQAFGNGRGGGHRLRCRSAYAWSAWATA
ncbi:protein of unknown function [Streptomyces murinus]